MNDDDTLDPDEVGDRIAEALFDATAAHERAQAIDKIGSLIYEELQTAYWPETKDMLEDMLERCGLLLEIAHADYDDAARRDQEASLDLKALRGE